jgi:threonine/homoserine/homoserine lactone efflux protein
MLNAALQLIPYALVASLSPVGFAATAAVIRSGRLKALGFAIGFVSGQLLACSILVALGGAVVPEHEVEHPRFAGLLELGFGLVLLAFAARLRRPPPAERHPGGRSRSEAAIERLRHLHVLTSLVAGLLLGIGGPKRLVLTVLAAASITAAGVGASAQVGLVVWYGTIATVLVWAPVLAFVILGERAVSALDAAQEWLKRHQRRVVFVALVIIGLLLVADGIAALV